MNNKSYNMDCMDYMRGLPDNAFDLAVVDPEYGINAGKKKKYHKDALTQYKKKNWDKAPPNKKYFDALFRISKNQIIFGGNYFTTHLPPSKNWIVWDKKQPEGISLSMHELAFCSIKNIQAKIIRMHNGANRVSNNPLKAAQYIRIHPTQKPVALYKWILQNYAKPGDKILDTHEGSGSLKIACHDMGFYYRGTELDADYFGDSQKRYKRHIAQGDLFQKKEIQVLTYNQGGLYGQS